MTDKNEKIYVGITAQPANISKIDSVLLSIMTQSIKPDKIILSLSIYDFPGMDADFPDAVKEFIYSYPYHIVIRWFFENYNDWMKHLGLLEAAEDDTLLISVDSEGEYPYDFIEKLYSSYVYYKRSHPVTWNREYMSYNLWSFCGGGSLYRKSDWGAYQKYLTHDALHGCIVDDIVDFIFAANGTVIYPMIYNVPSIGERIADNESKQRTWRTMNALCNEIYSRSENIPIGSNTYTPRFWLVFARTIEQTRKSVTPAGREIDKHMKLFPLFTYTNTDPQFLKEYLSKEYVTGSLC